jgi:hypothetical protein
MAGNKVDKIKYLVQNRIYKCRLFKVFPSIYISEYSVAYTEQGIGRTGKGKWYNMCIILVWKNMLRTDIYYINPYVYISSRFVLLTSVEMYT